LLVEVSRCSLLEAEGGDDLTKVTVKTPFSKFPLQLDWSALGGRRLSDAAVPFVHKMTQRHFPLALMGTGRGVCHHLGHGLLSCSLKASYSTNQMTVSSLSLSLSVFWWTDPLRLSLSHLDSDEIFPRVAMLSLVRSASGGDSFQRLIAKYSQIILTLRVPEMFLERVS
jgi:hypothetical protein